MANTVKTEQELIGAYTLTPYTVLSKLELSRGDDFREVYIVQSAGQKFVIKHTSNAFTDEGRIVGIMKLMAAYNDLGIYTPKILLSRDGKAFSKYTVDDREYFVYAEEFARYETAEHIGEKKYNPGGGRPLYYDKMFRSLGKVASAHLDIVEFPSAYCILKPFCPPDTVDEQTECAELFFNYIYEDLPEFKAEADELRSIFYELQGKIAEAYPLLPTSCFQADLGATNVLLDENYDFAGLIDFNLCGKEGNVNYPVREALWQANIFGQGDHLTPGEYEQSDLKRRSLFLQNLESMGNTYPFTDGERALFPYIYNYADSIWWQDIDKIKRIHEDRQKVSAYLAWLKKTMTRKDILLP